MKTIIIYLVLLSSITIHSQTQIGADINGEIGDGLGGSVSLSSDGETVAVGATGYNSDTGLTRVYKKSAGDWVQMGNDIIGEAEIDRFGSSVSLSSDGTTLAIGAPGNDENGNSAGQVRIYKFELGDWVQIGADINAEAIANDFGWSVSLSADGSILAVGAPNNHKSGSVFWSGHVRVYKNVSGVWIQMGDDIDGEAGSDYSGWSVSLSSDGSIVAIGARGNGENGINAGHVRVYKNISGVWIQMGDDIDGEAAGDYSGWSVSLSSDGATVAIGATLNDENGNSSGHVRVYEFGSGVWAQVGDDINGKAAGDKSGHSVSLSSDGKIVAIGAIQTIGYEPGYVNVYMNISNVWTQIGVDIYVAGSNVGGFGYSVSLSSNANTIAIGTPSNSSNRGRLAVYDLTELYLNVSDHYLSENFTVFPNPVDNLLQMQFTDNLEYKKAVIYNCFGQLILQSDAKTIDVSDLRSGIYFLEVETNKGNSIKKIIKK
ncbi:T9SS type A sorting domain-containing protein [Brumimicrobium glaciale]|uniref:T9SS type A sorting domain-containing protein n=1 Tax=Brumimicrobium glaciale TaxID=200475 RepID=A0A4Q4KKW7_9FLAO|nr:T9SS type A sorting domain-containing protein [Brumimicrobium glaciale]RYM34001.1 T9SS type A sorting domain-containing protein [Brumimicrobium glaciale]